MLKGWTNDVTSETISANAENRPPNLTQLSEEFEQHAERHRVATRGFRKALIERYAARIGISIEDGI